MSSVRMNSLIVMVKTPLATFYFDTYTLLKTLTSHGVSSMSGTRRDWLTVLAILHRVF